MRGHNLDMKVYFHNLFLSLSKLILRAAQSSDKVLLISHERFSVFVFSSELLSLVQSGQKISLCTNQSIKADQSVFPPNFFHI